MKTVPVLIGALLAMPLAAQSPNVGDKVADCTFPTFLNGDGRQTLKEFFGQPVLLELWGRN